MCLWTLALRLLALLALRAASLTRCKPLCVEASLTGLLHATATLRALPNTPLADPDTRANVLHANVAAVRLVRVLRGASSRPLTERRARGRCAALTKTHEALHALTAASVQASVLVLAVLARREAAADVHVLANGMLRVVLVADFVIRVRVRLLTVQALTIRRLRLD